MYLLIPKVYHKDFSQQAAGNLPKGIKENLYVEAARRLQGLYKSTGNKKEELYWTKVLEEIEETGVQLPRLDEIPEEEDRESRRERR